MPRQESWEILDLGSWIPAVSIETETFQLKRPVFEIWDSKMPQQEFREILDLGSWIPAVSIETEKFQLLNFKTPGSGFKIPWKLFLQS